MLDLSFIERQQYKNGDLMVGDLEKLGWAMYRSRYVESFLETEIRNICGKGVWHAIGDLNNTRMMNYQTISILPRTWKSPTLTTMFESIKIKYI